MSANEKKSSSRKSFENKNDPGEQFPIVAIGASAGGLEALEVFFDSIPSQSGLCFIIIQHLSPTHKSIMNTILKKHTEMQVFEVEDAMELEKNCIYLNPPGKNMSLLEGKLYLEEIEAVRGLNLPIDFFFTSLAQNMREKSICVILSGTGADGMLGLKAVKGAGGLVVVQDEKQAKYDGMPRSAVSTGLVDLVLPVEKMGDELIGYVNHSFLKGDRTVEVTESHYSKNMNEIFNLIMAETGHDFSHYKKNTICRRIERRLAVHQIGKIDDYVNYLKKSAEEVHKLFKDLLIGVTTFFRDTEAFDILKNEVLPLIIKKKKTDIPIRIWVPGCATGEEAYSIAILFLEVMEKMEKYIPLQIFATDIDSDAIEFARAAVYPAASVTSISDERLNRFFVKEETSYKISKKIRDMIVFSIQDLIKDPPFSKLDMVCCRNVLIYMDQVLQKKLLPLFHYTLQKNGILFLGSSESIGDFGDRFTPLNSKWKMFIHKTSLIKKTIGYSNISFIENIGRQSLPQDKTKVNKKDVLSHAERIILENYASPCVLIDGKHDILYFTGNTEQFLTPPVGAPTFNILKMARDDLRYKLSTALLEASKQNSIIQVENILIKDNDKLTNFNLIVRPLTGQGHSNQLMIVVFEEKKNEKKENNSSVPVKKEAEPRIIKLEQELQSTKEYLQTTIEELETSNEELKSANEELQSVNEELQSANEELETSKEELQSTNEELVTVNSELQSKVDELSQVNNDIANLLASTEIGTIFLDIDLRIKRFTPAMKKIFNLIDSDLNRPISDITSTIEYSNLYKDAKEVLDTLVRKKIEVADGKGRYYSMKINPYRTSENVIEGLVITFVDISHLKKSETDLFISEERYRMVAEISDEGIYEINTEGLIVFANKKYARMFGYEVEEFIGRNWMDFISPKVKEKAGALYKKMLAGEIISGRGLGIDRNGKEVVTQYQSGPIFKDGVIAGIIGTIKDISEPGEDE